MAAITLSQLTVDTDHVDPTKLLETWRWLVPNNVQPMIITAMGDMFLTDIDGKVYWLNTIDGVFGQVSETQKEFKEKWQDRDQLEEWFLVNMVGDLLAASKPLGAGECYSFRRPPILGGDLTIGNIDVCDVHVHFNLAGQLHEQIKDLPEGTDLSEIQIDME